ncbi:hypothetical protein BKA81DRAFT_406607 [Phyllosticta paracitricarpa]
MSSLLVYRHTYTSPGHSTISTMTPSELSSLLASSGPRTMHTTLQLPRGASTVAIRQIDLLTPNERDQYAEMPNMRNVVATFVIEKKKKKKKNTWLPVPLPHAHIPA